MKNETLYNLFLSKLRSLTLYSIRNFQIAKKSLSELLKSKPCNLKLLELFFMTKTYPLY